MGLSLRPRWIAAGIFFGALLVRLLHAWQMSTNALFADPAVDAASYAEHASRLAAGQWLGRGQGPFWQPPLYPYVLGLVKLVFPESFFYAARVIQALIGAGSCVLVYRIGSRAFDPVAGTLAAIAAAIYGPLIYFDARLLPTGVATFAALAGLLLLLRGIESRSRPVLFGAGVALGIASIAVATFLALVPMLALWMLLRFRGETGRGRSEVVSILLGVGLVLAPVTLRNDIVGEDVVLISYNGGVNFYLGNNADVERTLAIRPGWEWERLMALPLLEGVTRPSAKSAFFYERAFEFIRASPLSYLGLLGAKTIQFWSGDEVERNQQIYYWRKYSTVLACALWKWGLAFPFGLVSPLALLGLLVYIRREGVALPVIFVLGYSVAVIAFFVTSRYRLPIVPLLLIFAAYGGHWLYLRWREKTVSQALWPTALLGLMVVLVNWDLPPMDQRGTAATHNDLGNAYLRQGRHDLALLKYQQAVRLDTGYWQAWFNLGSVRALRGDWSSARPIFERVLEHHPERADVWSNLTGVYLGLGDYPQATRTLEAALQKAPPRPDLYIELIRLYIVQRQYQRADAAYHQALLRFPDNARLHALHALHDEINH